MNLLYFFLNLYNFSIFSDFAFNFTNEGVGILFLPIMIFDLTLLKQIFEEEIFE